MKAGTRVGLLFVGALTGCSGEADTAAAPVGRPVRILPANAAALDFLLALVPPERLVAVPVTTFDWADTGLDAEHWQERTLSSYVAEPVLAWGPDLVVTSEWQNAETTALLRRAGVRVVAIPDVVRFEDILTTLQALGRAVGEPERAAREVRSLRRRAAVLTASRSRPRPAAMTFTYLGAGAWTAGRGTTVDVLFALAGLRNAAAEAGLAGHAAVDIETLLTIDPEVIVVAEPSRAGELSASLAYLQNEPSLARLAAVAEGHVVALPAHLFAAASQQIVDAAETLVQKLESAGVVGG